MASSESGMQGIFNFSQNESELKPAINAAETKTLLLKNGSLSSELFNNVRIVPENYQHLLPNKSESSLSFNLSQGFSAGIINCSTNSVPSFADGHVSVMSSGAMSGSRPSTPLNSNGDRRAVPIVNNATGNLYQTALNTNNMSNIVLQNARNGMHVPFSAVSFPQYQLPTTQRESPARESIGMHGQSNALSQNSVSSNVFRPSLVLQTSAGGSNPVQINQDVLRLQQHIHNVSMIQSNQVRPNIAYMPLSSVHSVSTGVHVANLGSPAVTSIVSVNSTRPSLPQTLLVGHQMTRMQSSQQQLQLLNIQPNGNIIQTVTGAQRPLMPRGIVPISRQPSSGNIMEHSLSLQQTSLRQTISPQIPSSYRLINGQVVIPIPQTGRPAIQPNIAGATPQRLAPNIAPADLRGSSRNVVPSVLQTRDSSVRHTLLLPAGINPGVPGPGLSVQQPLVFRTAFQQMQPLAEHSLSRPIAIATTSSEAILSNPTILENVKKCRSFLSTLLKLAAGQQPDTLVKVTKLVQDLLDGSVDEDAFTTHLESELKSEPQPTLVTFLKKYLPYVRQLMLERRLQIEGLRPPNQQNTLLHSSTGSGHISMQVSSNNLTSNVRPVVSSGSSLSHVSKSEDSKISKSSKSAKSRIAAITSRQATNSVGSVSATSTSKLPSVLKESSAKTVSMPPPKEKRKYEPTALKDDDDINDVAEMGGVNLSEESRNILATTSLLTASQLRSCKEETLLNCPLLLEKLQSAAKHLGIEEVEAGVATVVSHALEERLRNMLHKMKSLSSRRLQAEKYKNNGESLIFRSKRETQVRFLDNFLSCKRRRLEQDEEDLSVSNLHENSLLSEMPTNHLKGNEDENNDRTSAVRLTRDCSADKVTRECHSDEGKQTHITMKDFVFALESDTDTKHSPLLYRALLKQ